MGVLRHRLTTFFTFLLLSSASAITLTPPSGGVAVEIAEKQEKEVKRSGSSPTTSFDRLLNDQKRFGGPGSFPPSCRSKCGWCSPCKPVHIPIQPGLSIPLEYYPEAWRCKCGDKLYMP